jgi:hypothetical protein
MQTLANLLEFGHRFNVEELRKAPHSLSRLGVGGRVVQSQLIAIGLYLLCAVLAVVLSGQCLAQGEPTVVPTGDFRVTAVFIEDERIEIDGEFSEPEWELSDPVGDFIQNEPMQGRAATEQTEVRLLYDSKNLYVGAYCFDSQAPTGLVAMEMKRDFSPRDNDFFQVVFDTFNDKRNAVAFGTNPKGAKRDMQTGGDGQSFNSEWDTIWHVQTKITDEGWQAEFAIPFRSLRFPHGKEQSWGINFDRRIRRKSESTHWAPIPQPYLVYRVSLAGSLHGVRDVQQGRNLYVKPYVSAPLIRAENDDVDFKPDAGLDVKYGISSGLTLDLTLNTDFSQVEADDAQINFTRFSLFFPEKREFFLENSEIFDFGNTGIRFGGSRRRGGISRPGTDLIPFFSRRIGIDEDRLVPILGGGRVTGRAGRYRLGLISMQTARFEEIPSTNFTVARLRRDIFRNSDIGVIFVNKKEVGDHFNRTYGVDVDFRFFNYLELSSYLLGTDTPGVEGRDGAGYARVAWRDRLFDVEASHISIQENFNAEVGFVPRVGIRKSRGQFGLTPRPEGRIPWVREFNPSIDVNYITNQEGILDTREVTGRFSVEFNDSSRLSFGQRSTFERLFEEDEVLDEILPAGDYRYSEFSASYFSDRSRMFSGSAQWREGGFYDGDRRAYGFGLGFFPSSQFGVDLFWDHVDVSFPARDVETDLLSSRVDYSFNTQMFLSGLIQYSSRDGFVASNIRFRWIHSPLSDFYLVYNERRVPEGDVIDRALIAKLTYLFSF